MPDRRRLSQHVLAQHERTPRPDLMAATLQTIAACTSHEQLLSAVVSAAPAITTACGAAIVLQDGDHCRCIAESGSSPRWSGRSLLASQTMSGLAMNGSVPLISHDLTTDRRLVVSALDLAHTRSVIAAPVPGTVPPAVLALYWRMPQAFGTLVLDQVELLRFAIAGAMTRLAAMPPPDAVARQNQREGAPALTWQAGSDGRWAGSSPQWLAFTGQSAAAALDYGWLDALHPSDRDRCLDAGNSALTTGVFEVEHRIFSAADGRYVWFLTSASATGDKAGEIIRWKGTSIDADEPCRLRERQVPAVYNPGIHKPGLHDIEHNVRNVLATVRSVARRTAETSGSVEAFAMHLDGRIDSLARARSMVARHQSAGVDLSLVIAEELLAQAAHEGEQISIVGPDVRLRPVAVEALALALHELASNAVQYGALTHRLGRIAVTWGILSNVDADACSEPKRLRVEWLETSPVMLAAGPRRRGFGTDLIERGLAYTLGADSSLTFEPTGMRCIIDVPFDAHVVNDG